MSDFKAEMHQNRISAETASGSNQPFCHNTLSGQAYRLTN